MMFSLEAAGGGKQPIVKYNAGSCATTVPLEFVYRSGAWAPKHELVNVLVVSAPFCNIYMALGCTFYSLGLAATGPNIQPRRLRSGGATNGKSPYRDIGIHRHFLSNIEVLTSGNTFKCKP